MINNIFDIKTFSSHQGTDAESALSEHEPNIHQKINHISNLPLELKQNIAFRLDASMKWSTNIGHTIRLFVKQSLGFIWRQSPVIPVGSDAAVIPCDITDNSTLCFFQAFITH